MEDLIVGIVFMILFVASGVFYTVFTFKKKLGMRNWIELGLWTTILLIALIRPFDFNTTFVKIWNYTLGVMALIVVVTKLINLIPKNVKE